MSHETHNARVIVPIPCHGAAGAEQVPAGPCMMEGVDAHMVELIWGATGQESAQIPIADLRSAVERGDLVLLD